MRESAMLDTRVAETIDVRIRVDEMEAIRLEAHRILRDDPPEGHVTVWFPRVLRRAAENVRRHRKWQDRRVR